MQSGSISDVSKKLKALFPQSPFQLIGTPELLRKEYHDRKAMDT